MITISAIAPGLVLEGLKAGLIVTEPSGYIPAYQRILADIRTGEPLDVLVRNRKVAGWLNLMAQRYGPGRIQYKSITVRSYFEEHIGITVPQVYSDQDISASGLLQLNIPASGHVSFEEYILETFFGAFLNKPGLIMRVHEILAAYEPGQWTDALNRPLVKRIYLEKFRRLQTESAGNPTALLVLQWLEKSPEVYIRNLSALKLVRSYDALIGKRVFGNIFPQLLQLNLDLRHVPLTLVGNENALFEIRTCLSQVESNENAGEALDTLLDCASGFLEDELLVAVKLLKKRWQVTIQDVKRISRKFVDLQSQPHIAQVISELELLIAVAEPSEPQENWGEEQWLDWAIKEYLPYRFWLENTSKLNDRVGEIAGKFGDWLFANYGKLLYNSKSMAWKAVLELRERLKAHSGPVLVVILDNFNLKYYSILQQQMKQQAFYEQDLQYCFSMLPTFTEVSKKCIITGSYKPFEGSYSDTVRSAWEPRLDKKVSYLPNIMELRQVTQRAADIYFLNYIPIDMVLHQPDSQTGISHRQTIQLYLSTLAQDIRAFAHRLGSDRDLMVIFTSDHGSTRIPSQTLNVLNNPFYKKHATDEHHRFLVISDQDAEKLSKETKYDCYVFKRAEYHLPENYLVARRLYRFLSTNDSVYIHGGLTPEEAIVPLAIYQPFITTPRPLKVCLIKPNKIIAGTRLDLVLEITNHNGYPIEQATLEITSANLDIQPSMVDEIPQMDRFELNMKCRCLNGADLSEDTLPIRLSYKVNNQEYEQLVTLPVVFDSMFKAKASLDDL